MHHSLLIAEVVSNICSRIPDVKFERSGAGPQTARSQLFALAQTCRQFQQPALGVLWESISGIDRIIKCAGKDLWENVQIDSRHTLRITRQISPTDIMTMEKYGSLVRHFTTHDSLDVWKAVQHALEESNRRILFPNVSTLNLSGNLMDFAVMFGTHNLTSFNVYTGTAGPMSNPSSLVDFSARSQGLTSLELRLFGPKDQQAAVDAMPHWQNLTTITSTVVTPEVFHSLSRCKGLRHIHFEKPPKLPLVLTEVDSTMFQSLQDVWTVFNQLSDASIFIESLPATCNLQTFTMFVHDKIRHTLDKPKGEDSGSFEQIFMRKIYEARPAREESWLSLLHALEKYSQSLKRLYIADKPVHNQTNDVTLSNKPFYILATHFGALSHLELTCAGDYGINDEDVRLLTEALPLLEEFRLDSATRFRDWTKPVIKTTIASLVSFAQNCPLLLELCFIFDASRFKTPKYSEESGQALKLTGLDVAMSPVPVVMHESFQPSIAKFLLRIFPNLEYVSYETHRKIALTPVDIEYMYIESWEVVNEKIREIVKVESD